MKRDKWGLPRPWRFWADPFFWIILCLYSPKYVYLAVCHLWPQYTSIEYSLVALLVGIMLLPDLATFWVAYDTYRWEIPNRSVFIILVLVVWLIGMPYYLLDRPRWLAELERRRHLPI